MTRLKTIDSANMTKRQRQIYEQIVSGPRGQVRGPLNIWLYRPELADRAQRLGQYCRYYTCLEPRLSELAILTTARIWDAESEWQAHVPHALSGGLDSLVIDSLGADQTPKTVDLIGLLGYYALISMTIKTFNIPSIEDEF